MKRWALLALLTPASALAGPFTLIDAVTGVDVDVSYQWELSGATVGPYMATFSFDNPAAFTSTRYELCDNVTASAYCFTGTFSTSNSGFGTYQSVVELDGDSCAYGSDSDFPSPGAYFKTAVATCELVQNVTVTFGQTGVEYELQGKVLDFTYESVFNFPGMSTNRRRRGQKPSTSTTVTAATPASSFGTGAMSGISGGSVVSGTFVEI